MFKTVSVNRRPLERVHDKPRRSSLRAHSLTVCGSSPPPKSSCPVSLKPLDPSGLCRSSGLKYEESEEGFWDLTIGAAANAPRSAPTDLRDIARSFLPKELKGFLPTTSTFGTSTFELPSVAFAYERGWRQSFARAGFPGPDEEFKLAQEALKEGGQGGVLVDASCGSGLFSRRFVQSDEYDHVIALDFSDSMLRQAKQFFEDERLSLSDVSFVRADIGRLPFEEESIAGVHAGAAIHCWPSPEAAVAEVARVLQPGGIFCGTTFMYLPENPIMDDQMLQAASSVLRQATSSTYTFWDKLTLKELFEKCGFVDFECDIRQQFIFFKVRKPFAVAEDSDPLKETAVTEEDPLATVVEPEII